MPAPSRPIADPARASSGAAGASGAEKSDDANGTVQSVDRALTILELLASDGDLGVTQIAKLLDVHKSTASRLLATLEAHGLAEQLPDRGGYRLGVGVLRLAGSTRVRLDIVRESRPIARELAARTGETVNLVILSGTETLYLDQVEGTSALQIYNWVGRRNPVYATANGRVLLAFAPLAQQNEIISAIQDREHHLPRLTAHTLTTPEELERELDGVRDRGYATAVDELEIGLTAIAAPIRGTDGEVLASLSVSGPSFRLGPDRVSETVQIVVEAAGAVSRRMGYTPATTRRD